MELVSSLSQCHVPSSAEEFVYLEYVRSIAALLQSCGTDYECCSNDVDGMLCVWSLDGNDMPGLQVYGVRQAEENVHVNTVMCMARAWLDSDMSLGFYPALFPEFNSLNCRLEFNSLNCRLLQCEQAFAAAGKCSERCILH